MKKPIEQPFPWRLDWNLLRTFMVIVERGSITRAAEALGMQQPSLSNALKRLEASLETRLIDRKPNYFRITAAGRTLYKECVPIFESVARFPDLLHTVDSELGGLVTISVASHVVCPLFDRVLQLFNADFPKVRFQINVEDSQTAIRKVRQKQSSLGICLVETRDPQLTYQQVYREYFGFFCGPSHPLFSRENLKLADLRGQASVSFSSDYDGGALDAVSQLRAKTRIQRRLSGVSASLHEVRRMIVAGLGIGPLPLHIAAKDVEAGRLRRLPPLTNPPSIDIYLVSNPGASLNRAESAFIDTLRREIEATPLSARTYR